MLFKDYIYLDDVAVKKYSAQLSGKAGKKGLRVKSITSTLTAGIGPVSAQADVDGEMVEAGDDPLMLAERFERDLVKNGGDRYFDAVMDDVDLTTLMPMSMIRLAGRVEIPEAFDMLALTKKYLPYIAKSGIIDSNEGVASEFAWDIIEQADADVPVVVNLGEITLFGMLKPRFIMAGGVESIEELEERESILLCKAVSYSRGDEVTIYDPLKDFVNIGRAMRRQMDRSPGLEPLVIPGPVLRVEVVAIYQ